MLAKTNKKTSTRWKNKFHTKERCRPRGQCAKLLLTTSSMIVRLTRPYLFCGWFAQQTHKTCPENHTWYGTRPRPTHDMTLQKVQMETNMETNMTCTSSKTKEPLILLIKDLMDICTQTYMYNHNRGWGVVLQLNSHVQISYTGSNMSSRKTISTITKQKLILQPTNIPPHLITLPFTFQSQ